MAMRMPWDDADAHCAAGRRRETPTLSSGREALRGWVRCAFKACAAVWLTYIVAGCGRILPVRDDVDDQLGFVPTAVFPDDADPETAAMPFREHELLVQPYPGADADKLRDAYAGVGAIVAGELTEIGLTVLEVSNGELGTVAAELAAAELVEAIHKNYILEAQEVPNDPLFTAQSHLQQVGAEEAWDITVGLEDVIIAIVDTGVDDNHPDLRDKVIGGTTIGRTSATGDQVGHGTRAAGLAGAASDNRFGVAGISWESPILAVRVTDDNGKTTSGDIAAGILWAVANDASVINVSFAPLWSNSVVRSAAARAYNSGALVVISAGNTGKHAKALGYPEALFVGAVDAGNSLADFSSRGPFVDVVAPGSAVWTTSLDSNYAPASGTSFSAPIVSGVVALVWSVNPELRPVTVSEILAGTTLDLGARGRDDSYGNGAVSAIGAVRAAVEADAEDDVDPPTLHVGYPRNGSVLRGRSLLSVDAEDDWGVADVTLAVDAIPFATDTRPPYRFVLDAAAFDAGAHELSFTATDVAGNVSTPQVVSVVFADDSVAIGDGLPAVEFRSPAQGARVTGNVTIEAGISAEAGLSLVEWLVDGDSALVSVVSGKSSGISFVWRR